MNHLTTEKFISKSKLIHGEKYDYSKIDYKNCKTKVNIVCRYHGDFFQTPDGHLQGKGCPKCKGERIGELTSLTPDEFLNRIRDIHGNKYDYSNVYYSGSKNKIEIGCKKHGKFKQTAGDHLSGRGCRHCKSSKNEQKIQMFLEENNIKYQSQYLFKDCRGTKGGYLKYDFYLPHHNTLIEYDGEQHFGKLCIGKYTLTMNEYVILKEHDAIKDKYASTKNIKLIRIPYWDKSRIDNILAKELSLTPN